MRNSTFVIWAAVACLAGACGGKDAPTTPEQKPDTTTTATLAYMGADVSALARIEQAGGIFRSGGTAGDALTILRANGSNTFRLRLFVNPNNQDVQVNDLAYTIAMAKRVKASGAKFILDLHYSDTWADPGHQTVPAAWVGLDMAGLEQKIEDYSADVMTQLRAAGALPDIVQVGNEIDGGMLWPFGRVTGAYDNVAQWSQLARLLKAAIRGVKRPLQGGETVRIMLHYSQGGSSSGTQWFFSHVEANAVPYDIIGLSYYPWYHGTLADLKSNLSAAAVAFKKDIIVAETAYPWRSGGWENDATNLGAMVWPVTADGQAAFVRDLTNAIAATPLNHGIGVVWWYPESIAVAGLFVWGGGSLALFDANGNVLPAAGIWNRTSFHSAL